MKTNSLHNAIALLVLLAVFIVIVAAGAPFLGFWKREGTTVSPRVSGDSVSIGGTLSGTIPIVEVSSSTPLTVSQIAGHMIVLTGDGTTATLPAVSASTEGASAYFYVSDDTAKHIDVNGSDRTVLGDTALDNGDKVSIAASSRGDTITFICIDTDGWVVPNPPTSATDGG